MNGGLLGAGRIGTSHARALADMPEVTGLRIVDVAADHARRLAAAVGVQVAPSAGILAEWVDALVIATGSDTHAGLIHLAADARIPTFCEKPIALDLETTAAVLEHVQQAGIALQIGFMRRFDPGFREARRVVALGRLYIVRLTSHDPEPAHEPYIASSGGLFPDLSIHDFDILRWVTGQEVLEMYASSTVLADEVYTRYGDVDTARLSEGTMAVFTATRHDPRGYDVRMELFGSEDTVTVGWDLRLALRSLESGMATSWSVFPRPIVPN